MAEPPEITKRQKDSNLAFSTTQIRTNSISLGIPLLLFLIICALMTGATKSPFWPVLTILAIVFYLFWILYMLWQGGLSLAHSLHKLRQRHTSSKHPLPQIAHQHQNHSSNKPILPPPHREQCILLTRKLLNAMTAVAAAATICLLIISITPQGDAQLTAASTPLLIGSIIYYATMVTIEITLGILQLSQDREERLHQAEKQIQHMKRDTRLASSLHDRATSQLAYIAFAAQDNADTLPQNSPQQEQWNSINSAALTALDDLHHAIDVLQNKATDSHSSDENMAGEDLHQRLSFMIGGMCRRLDRLGYKGTCSLTGCWDRIIAVPVAEEIIDLTTQLLTNIATHANPKKQYVLNIRLSNDNISVLQMNELKDSSSFDSKKQPHSLPHSGRGLKLHRQTIEQLGGQAHWNHENGQWTFAARIPTTPTNHHN